MFGTTTLPPLSVTPNSRGKKVVDLVPATWVPTVNALQSAQSQSICFPLQGYLDTIFTGDKFQSEFCTIVVGIPGDVWSSVLVPKLFPMLAGVSIADLEGMLKDAPFKIPARQYADGVVAINMKIHQSLVMNEFPDLKVDPGTPIQFILTIGVYGVFGTVTVPGVTLKCGYIHKA